MKFIILLVAICQPTFELHEYCLKEHKDIPNVYHILTRYDNPENEKYINILKKFCKVLQGFTQSIEEDILEEFREGFYLVCVRVKIEQNEKFLLIDR